MTILISNLAIAGYRSFGKAPQYFDCFAKINVFIGQNNAGKSNVLRFLCEVYPNANEGKDPGGGTLARHLPDHPPLLLGIGEHLDISNPMLPELPNGHRLLVGIKNTNDRSVVARILGKLMHKKSQLDCSELCWTLRTLPRYTDTQESWTTAVQDLSDSEIQTVWKILTNGTGGDRKSAWEPQVLRKIYAEAVRIKTALVPAIRQIGSKGSTFDGFGGNGIIDRVARLQNPDIRSQQDRQRFNAIRDFLRDVTDRPDAEIEVPFDRDTIHVHMDGRTLPLESLGSGIHEVLILASAATVLKEHVVCIEEPELHLNPILQKKLLRYLMQHTENQYFITTHSAALMDTPSAEIYHIQMSNGNSVVERATTNEHRAAICEDLGYHPSDLLQANCILWVEGPSDRIYLNWWLNKMAPDLIEGIHYSIMFYGGKLASHLTYAQDDEVLSSFIALRRLNRRGMILIDSDRDSPRKPINRTKTRLKREFDQGPGHAWITAGREIENYLVSEQVVASICVVHPRCTPLIATGTKHDSVLLIRSLNGKTMLASKVGVAKHLTKNYEPDFSVLDLRKRIETVCKFIFSSNPQGYLPSCSP